MGPDLGRITTSEGQVGPLPSGTFPPDVGPWGLCHPPPKGHSHARIQRLSLPRQPHRAGCRFIIGGAFATVVKGFTEIIIEILTKTVGNVSFDKWAPGGFTTVGPFLTALVSLVILAAVVYFGLVKPTRPSAPASTSRPPRHRSCRPPRTSSSRSATCSLPRSSFRPTFRPTRQQPHITSAVERRRAAVARRR